MGQRKAVDNEEEGRYFLAVQTCLARQERREHPDGKFRRDGRWFPSRKERRDCCESITKPSTKFKMTLNAHCRTAEHISNLFRVDRLELLHQIWALTGKEETAGTEEGGKRGRPKSQLPRKYVVSVRVTDHERSQLQALSKEWSTSPGAILRDLIMDKLWSRRNAIAVPTVPISTTASHVDQLRSTT